MSQSEDKFVCEVVDRMKKQGLFDQFRKECLADVDTKPAYQNLQMRVHGAVNNFLSGQKWRPDLNKNQLRESLRRHLTDLQMLSIGVERVVDQVVNPKIHKDFKPQIDKVICEHLGLDYDQWMEKINAQEQRLANPNLAHKYGSERGIPSLMEIEIAPLSKPNRVSNPVPEVPIIRPPIPAPIPANVSGPIGPPGGNPNLGMRPPPPLGPIPISDMMHVPPPVGGLPIGMNSLPPADGAPYSQPGMPFGMPRMPFEFDPSGYYSRFPGAVYPSPIMPFPPHFPPGMHPNFNMGVMGVMEGLILPPPVASEADIPVVTEKEKGKNKKKRREKKERLEALTVEKLRNMQNLALEGQTVENGNENSKNLEILENVGTDVIVMYEEASMEKSEEIEVEGEIQIISQDVDGEVEPVSKEYHFAWETVDPEVLSEISVSSVHTSDLSSFEEDNDGDGMASPESDVEAEDVEKDVATADDDDDDDDVNENKLDLKDPDMAATAAEMRLELEKLEKPKRKSKKLLSLEYNYGDSDDEETREERKARLAEEKEERYLRRQQRRAELESKKKKVPTATLR